MFNLIQPIGVAESSGLFNLFVLLLLVAVSSMLASSLSVAVLALTSPVSIAIALNLLLMGSVRGCMEAGMAITAHAISPFSPTGSTPRCSRPSRRAPRRMC